MMPHPAQTSEATILATARALLERDGTEQLTLARLASELKIKAPSLYHHVASRAALLQKLNDQTLTGLAAAYQAALARPADTPQQQIAAMCRAHRAYALANPRAYTLTFATPADATQPDQTLRGPLRMLADDLIAQLVGRERALTALRGLWALVHGFAMLEINGQLQLGGDLDAAFDDVVAVYVRGLL